MLDHWPNTIVVSRVKVGEMTEHLKRTQTPTTLDSIEQKISHPQQATLEGFPAVEVNVD
jgi:hypothetical protein